MIDVDPDVADAYLVYADWLQGQGDVRGELIALQHGRKTKRAATVIRNHRAWFLGDFADTTPDRFELDWYCGFIKKATIGWYRSGDESDATDGGSNARNNCSHS